jgi:opacity protein-like surface antigen
MGGARMYVETPIRRGLVCAVVVMLASILNPLRANAQGFISPSIGYNFGGNAGCRSATDCQDKNWNFGGSIGALGSVVGFEAELTYEGEFTGDRPDQRTKVTTGMANFMIAPKIAIVQPYGLVGVGLIRTDVENRITLVSEAKNQIGWTIGGGVIIYLQKHVGVKGDIRYYHSFQALDLLGLDLVNGNSIDFGRAGLGMVFKF